MALSTWLRSAVRSKPIRPKGIVRKQLTVESLEQRAVMAAAATMWQIGSGAYDLSQTFQFHSNPAAKQVVYLDFDGHTTGNVNGSSWDNLTSPAWDLSGNGPSFTTTEQQVIQRIWARVAEDFAPFNLDVTTQDPGVEALRKSSTTDDRWGVRVVITPDDTPAPGAGGVSYIGSFNFNTDTPSYVFNVSEKAVAEAATHEVGHALGLSHDGTATQQYYGGQGSGATSWGPIMGAAYSPIVTQWSKGEYGSANNHEDDLSKITTLNGFTYRSDDYGNSQSAASSLLPQGATDVGDVYGLIEKNTDSDWFSFWSGSGAVSLNVNPAPLGPNLAIQADLYDANGALVTSVNPANALNAVVNVNVTNPGEYFLKVSGTGKGNPLTNGFSNYGSLGNYLITGSVPSYSGSTPTNRAPVANADIGSTSAGVAIGINVLANDSDADGDTVLLTGISDVVNGTASISGNQVIFTPAAGFTGTGMFTYTISDGKGGVASATATVTVITQTTAQSFTNNSDVTISASSATVVTSAINVTGLTGVLQDVDVKINIYHTWVSDLQITLIAPDGTRVQLFNRHGGSSNNLLGTTFNDSAATSIASGAAPFTGSFRPTQALSALNGKNANGVWRLEVRDNVRQDGGRIDSWTLSLSTTGLGNSLLNSASSASASGVDRSTTLPSAAQVSLANAWDRILAGPPSGFEFSSKLNLLSTASFLEQITIEKAKTIWDELFAGAPDNDFPAF